MKGVKVLAQKSPIVTRHASLVDNPPHIEPSVRFVPREVDGKFASAHREKHL